MIECDEIVNGILENNLTEVFNITHTDDVTNNVRARLDKLSDQDIEKAKRNMEDLLLKLYDRSSNEDFLMKENLIYYLGRIKRVNYPLLKALYYKEENQYLKLNLFFSILPSFDEPVEFDFVKKLSLGSSYDILLRSWTMAFFDNAENPYEYVDNGRDDITKAIQARIKRFAILLDKNNPKYLKALAYLLIDLNVIWLFINSRDENILSSSDYEVIEELPDTYEKFSEEKTKKVLETKNKILSKRK
ncbi:MAG: hypothetical protein HFG48_02545 [Bacilli bacterium]|nr:hypothetical protein [Bacilli bacterium]